MSTTERTVWVYRIPVNVLSASTTTVHHIPADARLLHVAEQHDQVALWFEVPDPGAPKVEHGYQLFGTGHGPIGDHLVYVGTVLLDGGGLVLHVYERSAS